MTDEEVTSAIRSAIRLSRGEVLTPQISHMRSILKHMDAFAVFIDLRRSSNRRERAGSIVSDLSDLLFRDPPLVDWVDSMAGFNIDYMFMMFEKEFGVKETLEIMQPLFCVHTHHASRFRTYRKMMKCFDDLFYQHDVVVTDLAMISEIIRSAGDKVFNRWISRCKIDLETHGHSYLSAAIQSLCVDRASFAINRLPGRARSQIVTFMRGPGIHSWFRWGGFSSEGLQRLFVSSLGCVSPIHAICPRHHPHALAMRNGQADELVYVPFDCNRRRMTGDPVKSFERFHEDLKGVDHAPLCLCFQPGYFNRFCPLSYTLFPSPSSTERVDPPRMSDCSCVMFTFSTGIEIYEVPLAVWSTGGLSTARAIDVLFSCKRITRLDHPVQYRKPIKHITQFRDRPSFSPPLDVALPALFGQKPRTKRRLDED